MVAVNDSDQTDLLEESKPSSPKNIQLFLDHFTGDLDQVPISFTMKFGLSPCDWDLKLEHRYWD